MSKVFREVTNGRALNSRSRGADPSFPVKLIHVQLLTILVR